MGLFGSNRKWPSVQKPAVQKEPDPISTPVPGLTSFEEELTALVNKYNLEALSNTPDFILAFYIKDCILAYNNVQQRRKEWFAAREEQRRGRESQLGPLEE